MSNTFPAIFSLGALLCLLWLGLSIPARFETRKPPAGKTLPAARVDVGLSALVAGLVGARAVFVALHWDYYTIRPVEMLWFWQGGLSWVGGALGSIFGLGLYAALTRQSFWSLADALALPSVVIALSSWTGCLLDGCAYGRKMKEGLLTPPKIDMFGGLVPRWPTQMVGVIYSLAILAVLYWLADRRLRPGVFACLSLSLIAICVFALSFTRADPTLQLFGLRLDTLGSAAITLLSLSGLALCSLRN